MKKLLYVLFAITLIFATLTPAASVKADCTTSGHSYTEKVASAEYLASGKTCTQYAKYYYKCTGCSAHGTETWEDVAGGKAEHTWIEATMVDDLNLKTEATCTSYPIYWKICDECQAISDTETFAYPSGYGNHIWDTKWTCNSSYHWHKCTNSECSEANDANAHTFVEKHDDTNHWQECSVCGYKKNIAAHTGEGAYISTDETQHWQKCSCGGKVNVGDHEYDNACDTTCNTCGHIRTITHDYTLKSSASMHWKECTVCGDKIEETGHDWIKRVLADGTNLKSAATCSSYAVYYKVCSVCGEINTTETFEYEEGGYAESTIINNPNTASQKDEGKSTNTTNTASTGDSSNTILWIAIMIAAGLVMTFVSASHKKRTH